MKFKIWASLMEFKSFRDEFGSLIHNKYAWFTLALSVSPFFLFILGVDFSSQAPAIVPSAALGLSAQEMTEAVFVSLRGSFTHTILEWSAFCSAIFVVILAFVHFKIQGDVTTPIIGVALFCAGMMDAFHTLAADRLIEAVADNRDLIPFTWAISRLFNALIMIAGVGILLIKRTPTLKRDLRFVVMVSLVFGLAAYLIIRISATSATLPQTTFPDSIITRPFDVLPLVLFILAGLFLYPRLYRKHPSPFSMALMLSIIPEVVAQIHMAFGSTALFDAHFNLGHFVKILAYLVPFGGLTLDYVRTNRALQYEIFERTQAEAALRVSESRSRAILANILDGVFTIDEKGTVLSANPAIELIFGYPLEQVVGQNIRMLAADPYHSAHDEYLTNFLRTGNKSLIGVIREVEGQRCTGTVFPMELTVSEVRVDGERLFVGIVRDISSRKEIDRMKSEFVSTVSHELRTPLTSIRGSLGLLRAGQFGVLPENVQRMIDLAERNSTRLIDLVNDLLDIEQHNSGRLEFNFEPVGLAALVEQSIAANQAYGDQYGVMFEFTESVEPTTVFGDHGRLSQVMANLLSNAAKFSPENSTVQVSITHEEGSFRVSVSDQGSGIPEEFQDRIFERFSQADSSDTRKKGGSGLGLNISKIIVEKHGGRIGFHSEAGKGATFHFTIPAHKPDKALSAEPVATAAVDSIPAAKVDDRIQNPRILILEDDPDAAQMISMMLQQSGCITATAHSADEAKRLLAEQHFHAITVDIHLPGQDGIVLIRELRTQGATKDLPIVVVSVDAEEIHRQLLFSSMGVLDWLNKPIDKSRLLAAIQRATRENGNGLPKVLCVEDDADSIEVIAALIGNAAQVTPALTLQKAKQKLQDETFDLVILDIGLPDRSGLDLLPCLKNGGDAAIPVIIFSGQTVDEEVAGKVDSLLIKSQTSGEELLETIRSVLSVDSNGKGIGGTSSP